MQMAMGNFETGDDQSNSIAVIELLLRQANPFCDKH